MNSFFIQIMYCILTLIISLINRNPNLLRMKLTMRGLRNKGLWPIVMCDLTLICLSNLEANMRFFVFSCNIKTKYYPLFLFAFFILLNNFNIDIELL